MAEAKMPIVVIKPDLKQRDVTAFDLELARIPSSYLSVKAASSRMAAYLKAAIGAGWIAEPDCEARGNGKERAYIFDGVDVDDLQPQIAYTAGKAISDMYDEFTTLLPN